MPHPIQVEFKTTPELSGEESLLSPDNPFSDILEQLPQEDRFEPAFKPPQNPFADILEQLPKEDQPQKGLLPAGNSFQDIEETLSGSVDIQPEDDIDVIINDQQIRSVPRQIPQGDLEAGETPTPSPPDQRTNVGIIRQTKAKEPQNITGVSVIDLLIDFTDIGIIGKNIKEFNQRANRLSELQDKQLRGDKR